MKGELLDGSNEQFGAGPKHVRRSCGVSSDEQKESKGDGLERSKGQRHETLALINGFLYAILSVDGVCDLRVITTCQEEKAVAECKPGDMAVPGRGNVRRGGIQRWCDSKRPEERDEGAGVMRGGVAATIVCRYAFSARSSRGDMPYALFMIL